MRQEDTDAMGRMSFVVPSRPFLRYTEATAENLIGHHVPVRLVGGKRRSYRIVEAELTVNGHVLVTVECEPEVPAFIELDPAWSLA